MKSTLSLCSLSLVFLLLAGCGGIEGTSTGSNGSSTGGSDVSLSGTVTTPASSSKSVSFGLSAGKEEGVISASKGISVSKGSGEDDFEVSRVIVSKATSDVTANSGTCTVEKLDGTVIDTCIIQGGALSGCNFDQGKIPSDGQVEIICKSGNDTVTSLCDCAGITNGTRCSCGTINADTTLTDTLLHTNVDPNANPEKKTSTFTTQYGDGTLKPKQVFQTLKEQLGLDATAGSSEAKGAMKAVLKAVKGCMATLTSFTMADMASMVQTGAFPADCKSADSDLAGIDLTAAAPLAFKSGGATVNFFKDSTTAGKWADATAFQSLAKNFGAYGLTDLTAVINKPENARGLFNKYADDYKAGVANAFKKLEDGGKSFGNYLAKFGSTAMSSGQFLAAKDLFDNVSFTGGVDQAKLGEALYSQVFSADSEAEITKLRAQKGSIGSLLVSNPGAYTGAAGLAAAQGFLNFLGTGGSLTGATPCVTDSDCSGGKLCGANRLCFASVAGLGTGTGDIGAPCSAAGDCKTNSCSGGYCSAGVDFGLLAGFKYFGETCASTAECINGLTCNTTCGGIFSALGALDTAFDSDGFFIHNSAAGGNNADIGFKVMTDSSGRVLVAGCSRRSAGDDDMVVWRLNANGSLDTTFDSDGFFVHHGAAGGDSWDCGTAVTIDSSGRIVVAGYSGRSGTNDDMAVWRLNTNGSLDTTFDGDGFFNHNSAAGGDGNDYATGITIDSSGRILVVGYSRNGSGNDDMTVWRLNANGSLDTTFDSDGFFIHNSAAGGNGNDYGRAMALDSSGRIVVAGYSRNSAGDDDMAVWRLNANGSLDTTFDSDGFFIHNNAAGGNLNDFGFGMTTDSSGKILVGGYSRNSAGNDDVVVWRLNTNGSLDTTFDSDGFFTHNSAAGGNANDAILGITTDGLGKILPVGYSRNSAGDDDIAVWRLNTNGSLDTAFDSDGFFTHNSAAGGNASDQARNISTDSSGKILVVGASKNGSNNNDMTVWRLK